MDSLRMKCGDICMFILCLLSSQTTLRTAQNYSNSVQFVNYPDCFVLPNVRQYQTCQLSASLNTTRINKKLTSWILIQLLRNVNIFLQSSVHDFSWILLQG
jgi:hypothetical protein